MKPLQTLLWATAIIIASPALAANSTPAIMDASVVTGDRLEAGTEGLRLGAESREGLVLTFYPNAYGAVHDRREVALLAGHNEMMIEDIAPTLRPGSITVRLDEGTRLDRLLVDLTVDPVRDLLHSHIGARIRLAPRAGSDYAAREATLRAVLPDGRPLVETSDGLEVGGPGAPWRIVFPDPPARLQTVPQLQLDAETPDSGSRILTLDYLADGLGWQADYVGRLAGDVLRLTGHATLRNDTGLDFDHARVRLVAGEVHQAPGGARPMAMMARAEAGSTDAASETVAARRLYTIAQPLSLPTGTVLRVPLVTEVQIDIRRRYRVSGRGGATGPGQAVPVPVTLALVAEQGAEAALPAGVLRVYDVDSEATTTFIGADRIPDRPTGAPLQVALGASFDLTATRRQTLFERLAEDRYEIGWAIELTNRTGADRTVEIREYLPGDWEIVEASAAHESPTAGAARWRVEVPAGGEKTLTYRVRISR